MEFQFTVALKIQKPISEVFDAVYNPKKLSVYFGMAGEPLDEGRKIEWVHGNSETSIKIPVTVEKTVPDKLIRFKWPASEGRYDAKAGTFPRPAGYDSTVEFTFDALTANQTLVTVNEGTWHPTPGGLEGSYQNCQGWMNMLCCLKAYLEHGINLRQGAF